MDIAALRPHRPGAVLGAALAGVVLLTGGCVYKTHETVPAASPTTVVVTPGSQRTVTYPEGRYVLYGEGTTSSPYYWVWVPTGANPPAPPALPAIPR